MREEIERSSASVWPDVGLDPPGARFRELSGIITLGAGSFLLLSLASFDAGDYAARAFPVAAEVRNLGGAVGRSLATFAFDWVGMGASYALALGAIVWGVTVLRGVRSGRVRPRREQTDNGSAPSGSARTAPLSEAVENGDAEPVTPSGLAFVRPLGAFAVLVSVATIEHILHRVGLLSGDRFPGRNPGGYWGTFLATAVLRNFSSGTGAGVASLAGVVGLALALDVELLARRPPRRGSPPTPRPETPTPGAAPIPSGAPVPAPDPEPAPIPGPELDHRAEIRISAPRISPSPATSPADAPRSEPETPLPGGDPEEEPSSPRDAEPPPAQDDASPEGNDVEEDGDVVDRGDLVPRSNGPSTTEEQSDGFAPASDATLAAAEPYSLPPLTMLAPAEAGPVGEYELAMREKAAVLERKLQDFKIEARVVAVDRGPNITQYELELAAGVKVHRIMSLSDDIAMAMKAASIRIIAPIPGRSTVGVEVPNQDQETVRLRELVESDEHRKRDFAIPLFLGKDSTGRALVADLARMPHLLIAGATGSGKSVCMNTIITSVLLTRAPSDVKMILIDPKMVELSLYESIPHLLAPVVTDMRKASSVLEWAVNKMEERYGLLQRVEVRHLKNYNALGREEIAARLEIPPDELALERIPHHLPYVVVVIDEFADLMCVARKEVEGSIIRLAQKSRAVGIHLILATQRPTADVITGLIKSNMPCRIAFQVASKVDSRTIIDKNGAEMLVGQGDMLYLPPGTANVIRAQGTYVSEEEVKAIVRFSKSAAKPVHEPELVRCEGGERGADAAPGQDDDLYAEAVRIVLESQRGSASLLQRRLEVGYSRASRLIDIMTERGVLGPFKGSKAREILVTLEDWEAMQAREEGR